jgi:tryptophan 2,3-dioxygenase
MLVTFVSYGRQNLWGDHKMSSNFEEGIIAPEGSMVTYSSYLKITELLSLQQLLSNPKEHDEMLFIIIHQTYELWFKQILHELDLAERDLDNDNPLGALKTLKRVSTIMGVLTQQVSILETMTPNDFNLFRARLNPASGFQSHQFRVLEFRMGLKDPAFLKFFKTNPSSHAAMEQALKKPTFQDHLVGFLARRGYKVPGALLSRDVSSPWTPSKELEDILTDIYENHAKHYEAYTLLESLCDLDQQFTLWRYRHVAMVERMIGSRIGTGGSSGVKYLSATLSKRFFPEIWSLRSRLGSVHNYGQPQS